MASPSTPFRGRGRELRQLADLLRQTRLVTLVGPPGAGKTRLAREFAALQPVSAWFCDLAAAQSTDDLLTVVAGVLGVTFGGTVDADAGAQIGEALGSRGPALVILDNFEQLVESSAVIISRWLEVAPEARLLVTSRRALKLQAESRLEVGPLQREAAAALFVDRARAVCTGFELRDVEAQRLEELLLRLDRLPLPIELAAARTNVLSVADLQRRLGALLPSLGEGPRDVAQRHRTLEAALDWSWQLLAPVERAAFAQLAVFRGGFTLEAAEAVLLLDQPALDVVQRLRDQSLIHEMGTTSGGELRLSLYEGLREYADRRLDGHQRDEVQRRHTRFFLERSRHWAASSMGRDAEHAIGWLAEEMANIVAVYRRVRGRDEGIALEALTNLGPMVAFRGGFDAFAGMLRESLAVATGVSGRIVLRAQLCLADLLREAGRVQEAMALLEETACPADDLETRAEYLRVEGETLLRVGETAAAVSAFAAAAKMHEESGDLAAHGFLLGRLGRAQAASGQAELAQRSLARSVELAQIYGNRRVHMQAVLGHASVKMQQGKVTEAAQDYEMVARVAEELGDRYLEGLASMTLCSALLLGGNPVKAEACAAKAQALAGASGDRYLKATSTGYLAVFAWFRGEEERARALGDQVWELGLELGDPALLDAFHVAEGMFDITLARRAIAAGDLDAAARHRARAQARIGPAAPPAVVPLNFGLRSAQLLVSQALAQLDAEATLPQPAGEHLLVVGPHCEWFEVPGTERQVLAHRPSLRLILECLVDRRRQAPGEVCTRQALQAAGWPGEAMRPDSGARRVYVALWTLRKLGLREILLTTDQGFLLDPEVALRQRDRG